VTFEKELRSHGEQNERPRTFVKLPGEQGTQAWKPMSDEKVPVSQTR
jgi:hypothetical protein